MKKSMVEEVESLTGRDFEHLTSREIRGAILALEALSAIDPESMTLDEYMVISESVVAEHLIMHGDYKDGKSELPETK